MAKGSGIQDALNQLKFEIAQEHGIHLDQSYNGNLTAREAGVIGGNIVKRLIEIAEGKITAHSRK